MPLPYRWPTSLMMRYNGKSILIDCGEGTQIAMREKGWSPNPIDIICFTHFHADHISGLPGMLLRICAAVLMPSVLFIVCYRNNAQLRLFSDMLFPFLKKRKGK